MSGNVAKIEPSDDSVVIKIPKEKLSDFLGDFLKTKRQIGKRFPVVFHIKKEDIVNIVSVVDHRVREQNEAAQTDVNIEVLYDDGSNRSYPTLEFFNTEAR